MFHANVLDLLKDRERPDTKPFMFRCLRSFIESCALAMALSQLCLPEEERSPPYLEGIHRGLKAMFLPEHENLKLFLGFRGEHTVPPYRCVVAGDESSKSFECRLKASSSHGS